MATVYDNLANYIVNPTENDVYGDSSVGSGRILQELYLASAIRQASWNVNSIVSGFTLPSSGAASSATVAAGTAVVGGYYITGSDTIDISDALTGDGTWWVWLRLAVDGNGKVSRPELYIASGATRPTEPTEDNAFLGSIVVSSSTITGATDRRCQNQVCWGSATTDGSGVTAVNWGSNNWTLASTGLSVTLTWDTAFFQNPVGFAADGSGTTAKSGSNTTDITWSFNSGTTTFFMFFG